MINKNVVESITTNLVDSRQIPRYIKIYNKRQDLWIFISNLDGKIEVLTDPNDKNKYAEYFGFYKFVVTHFDDHLHTRLIYEIIARIDNNKWAQLTVENLSVMNMVYHFGESYEHELIKIKIFEDILSLKKAVNSFYIMQEDSRINDEYVDIDIILPFYEEA
jgi:hypothetical protein